MSNINPPNRKLLEQAAQAVSEDTLKLFNEDKWNPLDSDAAAFRLAVRLELDIIMPMANHPMAICKTKDGSISTEFKTVFEDPFKGVRRAIVVTASKVFQKREENNGKGVKGDFPKPMTHSITRKSMYA